MTNKSDDNVEIDHAIYDLLTSQYTKNPELCSMCCGDEFGLEFYWNGALNLYYDSVEELGWLAFFKCRFFASSRSDFRTEYVALTLTRGKLKKR